MVNKMFSSKKSEFMEYGIWLMVKFGFTITVIVVTLMFVNQGMVSANIDRSLDAAVLSPLIMYNDALMTVDEDTSRLYPGWIDMNKFNSNNIDEEFSKTMQTYDDIDYVSMNITLYDENIKYKKSVYLNKEHYEDNVVLVDSGFNSGTGGYKKYLDFYPIYYGPERIKGFLRVAMILPN